MSFKHRLFKVSSILLIRLVDGMTLKELFMKTGISFNEIHKFKKLALSEELIYVTKYYNGQIKLTDKGERLQKMLKEIYEVI